MTRTLAALGAGLALVAPLLSQSRPDSAASSPSARARAVLAGLSLEQKAGQLQMAWILSREAAGTPARQRLERWIADGVLGGVVLSLGSAGQAQALVVALQRQAPVPLLVAGDFETSCAFRLTGTTHLGNAMLLGAAGQPRLAYDAGRVTAQEATALGFHWCFAPVLDVNVNPANPIINVRSFGERPERVAALGTAFTRGLEDFGMLACGKHFPGHGDVATDSHLAMPTVTGDRARLEQIELLPFRQAIAAGISSLMTAHLAMPALGEDAATPATLSPRILTGLLRQELGFQGIITTDALDMGGVKQTFAPGEVAVRALAAGADLLLMPPDPVAARDAVVAAVRTGRVPQARLDEAVLRLLAAKDRLGLLGAGQDAPVPGRGYPRADWAEVVASRANRQLAAEIARRGLTLVRDAQELVPLPRNEPAVLVTLLDKDEAEPGELFARDLQPALPQLTSHRLTPKSPPDAIVAAAAALAGSKLALVALHVQVRSYSGTIGIPPALAPVVAALAAHPRALVVSFGNPYLLRDFRAISSYLCAYLGSEATEAAAAAALLGKAAVTGRLPVTIPELHAVGTGISVHPRGTLPISSPLAEGCVLTLTTQLRLRLEQAIGAKAFPGAALVVLRHGAVISEIVAGRETYADTAPAVTPNTVYDLASLTKVVATTAVALRLIARGDLDLDTPVQRLVPEFTGQDKERVTVRHLLTHSSGLPGYVKLFERMTGRDALVQASAQLALTQPPGTKTVYSDHGMILLMASLEAAGKQPFAALVQQEVCLPLGMRSARFAPTGTPIPAPPTEECPWRKILVQGQVHDENAYAMGGVSGHAGLFATALDVAKVGDALLGGGKGWLPRALCVQATTRQGLVHDSSRALGWDTFAAGRSGGSLLSPHAFGHTGFTGTSIWCDPERDLVIVLLTNRVHPTRDNHQIDAIRREIADLVVRNCLDR